MHRLPYIWVSLTLSTDYTSQCYPQNKEENLVRYIYFLSKSFKSGLERLTFLIIDKILKVTLKFDTSFQNGP